MTLYKSLITHVDVYSYLFKITRLDGSAVEQAAHDWKVPSLNPAWVFTRAHHLSRVDQMSATSWEHWSFYKYTELRRRNVEFPPPARGCKQEGHHFNAHSGRKSLTFLDLQYPHASFAGRLTQSTSYGIISPRRRLQNELDYVGYHIVPGHTSICCQALCVAWNRTRVARITGRWSNHSTPRSLYRTTHGGVSPPSSSSPSPNIHTAPPMGHISGCPATGDPW